MTFQKSIRKRARQQQHLLQMFSKHVDSFMLTMTVGLKCDHPIQTEEMRLYNYNGVYFPENWYCNCDPLPVEWIEIINRKKEATTITVEPDTSVSQLDDYEKPKEGELGFSRSYPQTNFYYGEEQLLRQPGHGRPSKLRLQKIQQPKNNSYNVPN